MKVKAGDIRSILDYALAYAEIGWPVFPVHYVDDAGNCSCGNTCKPTSRGKHPATLNGFKNATTNPDVIRQWFSSAPFNIAVACKPFNALDVDPRNGGDIALESVLEKFGPMPDTITAKTGGGGHHYLFIVPEGRSLRRDLKGVDVKDGGGYIVVEPSKHYSGGAYCWDNELDPLQGAQLAAAPEWLLEPAQKEQPPIPEHHAQLPIDNDTIASLRQSFPYLDIDKYETWLQVGQALHSENSGNQGFGLWVEASRYSRHFDSDECCRKWLSFTANKGLTVRSIFKMAQDNGWYNTGDAHQIARTETAYSTFSPLEITGDLFSRVSAIPKRQWLIQSHYLRGYVSATFAPGGVGKSMFQLAMAVSVATGMPLLGLEVVEQANVIIVNNEDDNDEMMRRLAAILVFHKIPAKLLEGRFFMLSGYGQPFTIASRLSDGTIISSPESEKLVSFIKEKNIGLVCLDPFISTHESEENANTEINKVISQYKHIAHVTQCAISLIHHTAKAGADSEAHAGDANSGRGASSLKDAARCVDTLAKMNQETAKRLEIAAEERPRYIRLDNGKLNFALGLGEANWFYMHSVQIPNGDWVGVPCPVSLGHLFDRASQSDKRVKWTATMVAEAFHSLMPKGVDSVPFSDIKANFMSRYEIADRQAREKSTMISSSEKDPTRIKIHGDYIDFWYSKEKPTSPVIIHRAPR